MFNDVFIKGKVQICGFYIANFGFRTNKGFDDTGFGSVFNGSDLSGNLDNILTQAVMSLMKNVNVDNFEDNDTEFVAIGEDDVQEHHIPRSEAVAHQGSN